MTAIRHICCLNCYQFWPNCDFCHSMFTSFQSLILEPDFVTQVRPGRPQLFYKQEAGRGKKESEAENMRGEVCPRKTLQRPAWL